MIDDNIPMSRYSFLRHSRSLSGNFDSKKNIPRIPERPKTHQVTDRHDHKNFLDNWHTIFA